MFKPQQMPQLIPYLTVSNAEKSIEFYSDAFGFTLVEAAKDEKGRITHVEMRKQDAFIMFTPEGAFDFSTKKTPANLGINIPVNMYIYCEDTDKLYEQAIARGAKSITAPHDSFWGDRFCLVLDPDGYEWGFGTLLK